MKNDEIKNLSSDEVMILAVGEKVKLIVDSGVFNGPNGELVLTDSMLVSMLRSALQSGHLLGVTWATDTLAGKNPS